MKDGVGGGEVTVSNDMIFLVDMLPLSDGKEGCQELLLRLSSDLDDNNNTDVHRLFASMDDHHDDNAARMTAAWWWSSSGSGMRLTVSSLTGRRPPK
jgi:glucuronate isomerase